MKRTQTRPNFHFSVPCMPITLTIHITHPDVVTGDARSALYNSIAQTLECLGPDWTHRITTVSNGNLLINFERMKSAEHVLHV